MAYQAMGIAVLAGSLMVLSGCSGSSSPATPKEIGKKALDTVKEKGKEAVEAGKEAVDAGKEKAKEAVEAAKEGWAQFEEVITKEMPAIQTKINGLSGDAKTKATESYEALKKALEEAKAVVADPEKRKKAWEDIKTKVADLKKQVGL